MENLFFLLFLVSIVALIVGMIKPDLVLRFKDVEKINRKNVLLIFGISIVVSFFLFIAVAGDPEEKTTDDDIEEVIEEEEEVILTLTDQEKDLLNENYGELSLSERGKVDVIIANIDEYEENDKEFIIENKDRIKEEKVAIEEKEQKEKEEQAAIDKEKKEAEELEAKEKKEQEEKEAKEKKEQEEKEQAEKEKEKYNSGISRNDMARDKDGLAGEYVTFSGKVSQVMEAEGYNQYRFAVDDDLDKMILIEIDDSLLESNILEDDYLKIEGVSFGNVTYETVLGSEMSIPGVIVDKVYLD